jgi:hypothetical protein
MNRKHRFVKTTLVASSLLVLGAVLCTKSAEALTFLSATCTPTAVYYAPPGSPLTSATTDVMAVTCAEGATYYVAVGTPGAQCFASADAVKALYSMALTARTSGAPMTMEYNVTTCYGVTNARYIIEAGL